jgi:hypothetical protein
VKENSMSSETTPPQLPHLALVLARTGTLRQAQVAEIVEAARRDLTPTLRELSECERLLAEANAHCADYSEELVVLREQVKELPALRDQLNQANRILRHNTLKT